MIVNLIKNWVSSLLCLGIITAFLQLIIPNSKFKKYINSLIGIVMIITVLSPVIKIYNDDKLKESVEEVISTFSPTENEDAKVVSNLNNSLVKEQFIKRLKEDAILKLKEKSIIVKYIDIQMDELYNIQLININIEKFDEKLIDINETADIAKYIQSEYDVDISKIKVSESGN